MSTKYTSCGRSSKGYYAQRLKMSKTDERGSVAYRTEDHMAILFQMYGSVWLRVLPYCVINTLLVLGIKYLRVHHNIDLSFGDQGHMFMSTMVSVLIVARSRITYGRYMEARRLLAGVMQSCRELIQHLVTFSRYEIHPQAKQWRADVSQHIIVCLRTLVSVLQDQSQSSKKPTKQRSAWTEARSSAYSEDENQAFLLVEANANERSPMLWVIMLRTAIASHVKYLKIALDVNEELKLLSLTSDFVTSYHGLMKLIGTPFPFPLVQMTRTFLFVWVFSLPFALMSDNEKDFALIIVFFISYGFIGLEFVSIELDDPFGDDPNDLDVLELSKVVFDDIYVCIHDIDGERAAMDLRVLVEQSLERATSAPFLPTTLVQQYTNTKREYSPKVPVKKVRLTETSIGLKDNMKSSLAALQAKIDSERLPLLVREDKPQRPPKHQPRPPQQSSKRRPYFDYNSTAPSTKSHDYFHPETEENLREPVDLSLEQWNERILDKEQPIFDPGRHPFFKQGQNVNSPEYANSNNL